MEYELFKQVVRPNRKDDKGYESSILWSDIKDFCNSLTEEQLSQHLILAGEDRSYGAHAISISIDDGINPSGECVEPRMMYSKSDDKEDRVIAHEEKTVVAKGTIIIEATI